MRATEFLAAMGRGQAGPAYFLRGPDGFLLEECRRAVMNSIPADSQPWCFSELEFTPGGLLHSLEDALQMPMLGGRKFLVVADPEDFKGAGDDDLEALRTYLERPSPFSTVVFVAVAPDRRRRFIQLLEKKAQMVELEPPGLREAAEWARYFVRSARVELSPELAIELAAKFEATSEGRGGPRRSSVNLLWMRTELEKLLTARPGPRRLERADLELLSAFREERDLGRLLRAIGERKCAAALGTLRELLASKVAETLILWSISDLFRQALRGVPRPAYGGWSRPGYPNSTLESAGLAQRNYRREELIQAMRAARRADLRIKSSWKDAQILLEFLVWQIVTGQPRSGESALGGRLLAD